MPANQPGSHLSASGNGPEGSEKFLKSFTWAGKCLLQTELNVSRKNLLVVLRCSYKQYKHKKANNMKLHGKMFTSEIDMQHVKKDSYKIQYFLRV